MCVFVDYGVGIDKGYEVCWVIGCVVWYFIVFFILRFDDFWFR